MKHETQHSNLDPIYPWPKRHVALPGCFELHAQERIQFPPDARDRIRAFRQDIRTEFGIRLTSARTGRIRILADLELGRESYRLDVNPVSVQLEYGDLTGLLYGLDTLHALMARAGEAKAVIPSCLIEDEPYKPMRGIHLYMPGRDNLVFFKRLLRYLSRLRLNTVFLEIGAGMEYKRHPEINVAWEKLVRYTGPFNASAERRVQQSQGYAKDSVHPELGGGSFLTQQEVKKLAAEAAQLGIEIIPEVQSLSHAYWLCLAYPEIAERPEDPFPDTYCPSNPRSYELLFDALTEVIDVFRPRMITIGHDEWYSIGLCPICRKRSGADLFLDDVNKIAAFLKARGVQTALWSDKLLNFKGDDGKRYGGIALRAINPKTGFQEIRRPTHEAMKQFPRDILVGHWYYSLSRTIDRALIRNGLNFFYGNFNPTIFQNWAVRSSTPHCLGGEMSTWVEVSAAMFTATGQLPLMALGANMLWSDRTEQSAPLPAHLRLGAIDSGIGTAPTLERETPAYRALSLAMPALRRYINGSLLPSEGVAAQFQPVMLDASCTMKVADRLNGLPFNLKSAMARLRNQGLTSQRIPFRFSQGSKVAIGLGFDSGNQVVISMSGRVKSLVFLHALHARRAPAASYANQSLDAHTVAVYRLVYADRSFVEQPVITCHTLGLFKSPFGVEQLARPFPAFPAWTDGRYTLYAYEWVNPNPEKLIVRLILEGTGASSNLDAGATADTMPERAGVLVFAISRVE